MLQNGSCQNSHLSIQCDFKRLGVKAGKDSLPFAIFVPPPKNEYTRTFRTLRSRLGVEFQCPHCHSNNIVKSGKSSIGKQHYRCKNCQKRFITDYTYKAYLPGIDSKITQLTKEGLGFRSTERMLGIRFISIYSCLLSRDFVSSTACCCSLTRDCE